MGRNWAANNHSSKSAPRGDCHHSPSGVPCVVTTMLAPTPRTETSNQSSVAILADMTCQAQQRTPRPNLTSPRLAFSQSKLRCVIRLDQLGVSLEFVAGCSVDGRRCRRPRVAARQRAHRREDLHRDDTGFIVYGAFRHLLFGTKKKTRRHWAVRMGARCPGIILLPRITFSCFQDGYLPRALIFFLDMGRVVWWPIRWC